MTLNKNRAVTIWLLCFVLSVALLVIWGGYTRLTRSGLSIVEWHPISGVIPPSGEAGWREEFAKYRETPEFQQINSDMTLEQYRLIFYIEWFHRLLARIIGLFYALPFFYFLAAKKIPWRESGRYVLIGSLFVLQAFAGWFMVASGLDERPSVSHYLLTFHLLLALSLYGLSLWTVFDLMFGTYPKRSRFSAASKLAAATVALLVLQIAYGGLTAGLKAGHVSDTWPLMSGRLIPPDAFPNILSVIEAPQAVVFIHRWLGFAVLGMAVAAFMAARRQGVSVEAENYLIVWLGLLIVQVLLGIGVVLSGVQLPVALIHQATALALLAAALLSVHRLGAPDALS